MSDKPQKSDRENGRKEGRTEGKHIEMAPEASTVKTEIRPAKTFIPNQTEILNEVPEAITAGERLPHVSEYSGMSLEAIPVKGLKSFLYGAGLLFIVLVVWEIVTVFKSALAIHWLIASSFLLLVVLVTGLGFRALRNFLRDKDNCGALKNIQQQAQRLSETHDMGNAKVFVQELHTFYADKPQRLHFQRSIEKLADYSNDREVIDHIDRTFLQPLDQEALRRISSFSLQTGTAVAISPWASLDMLLSLWRSIKMIDEIAQVYGLRPSLSNRYKLLKLVIHQLAFVGVTEIVTEQVVEEFASTSLSAIASARLGQGLGAGIYTARIGIAAMKVSRPIEFSKNNQPKTKSLISPLIENLKAMMSRFRM